MAISGKKQLRSIIELLIIIVLVFHCATLVRCTLNNALNDSSRRAPCTLISAYYIGAVFISVMSDHVL